MAIIGGIGVIIAGAIVLAANSAGFNLTFGIVAIICGIIGIVGGFFAFISIKMGGAIAALAGVVVFILAMAATPGSIVVPDLVVLAITFLVADGLQILGGALGYYGSIVAAVGAAAAAGAVTGARRTDEH